MTGGASPPNAETTELEPGARVGRYEILERIGGEAAGGVFRGRDVETGHAVAVRRIPFGDDGGRSGDTIREQLQRCRRAADRGRHLVRIEDAIEDRSAVVLVLELVEGIDLEHLLADQGGPLAEKQALGILGAIALGLSALHAEDLLHRDLKPTNVLLPRQGGLKIADYGLVALRDSEEPLHTGSARYMAPELLRGEGADARSDLYALGMIAYEMLAGRPAFQDAFRFILRDQRNQGLRWMKWHTNERTRATPLGELNPDIDEGVAALVGRLMAKSPADRPESADAVLAEIRRCAGQPAADASPAAAATPAVAAPAGEQAVPGARPREDPAPTEPLPGPSPMPAILLGIALFWSSVAAGVWIWRANQPEDTAASVARLRFRQARDLLDRKVYLAAAGRFATLADEWPKDHPRSVASAARADYSLGLLALDQDRPKMARRALRDAADHGVLDPNILYRKRRIAEHRIAFREAVGAVEKRIEDGAFTAARQRLDLLKGLAHQPSERARLERLRTRMVRAERRTEVKDTLDRARRLHEQGRQQEAIQVLRDAWKTISQTAAETAGSDLRRQIQAERAATTGRRALREGRFEQALAAFRRANGIQTGQVDRQRLSVVQAEIAYQRGQSLEAEGRREKAREAYKQALGYIDHAEARRALERLRRNEKHAEIVERARRAEEAGELENAIELYQKAIEIERTDQLVRRRDRLRVELHLERGRRALEARDPDRAKAAFEAVTEIDPDHAEANAGLARAEQWAAYQKQVAEGDEHFEQGDYAQAKEHYHKAKEIRETKAVSERMSSAEYQSLLQSARRAMEQGQWRSALTWLRTARNERDTEEVAELIEKAKRNVGD